MFRTKSVDAETLCQLEAVEALVIRHFGLAPADLVIPRGGDGAGPQQTTILFWKGGRRHRLVIFKAPGGIGADDLPPAWLAPGLVDDGDAECC